MTIAIGRTVIGTRAERKWKRKMRIDEGDDDHFFDERRVGASSMARWISSERS